MSSVVISGDTSGAITLAAPAVAGTNTATLPAATGTVMVSGNMPAFSYYQSVQQTLSGATFTKITFTTSEFDTTNGMYASSRFTPTIAGYYQVSFGLSPGASATSQITSLYKNGSQFKTPYYITSASSAQSAGSVLVYFNGSTDYVEVYGWFLNGQVTSNTNYYTYFQAAMVRGA